MTELTTLDEFRAAARPGIWITVTDLASGTHIHEAACPVLREDEFIARVVREGKPSGRYYATARLEEAMRMFGEVLCVPCRKRLGRGGIAAGRGNR
jgi:hypothetical protein